jgi:hypothetical protein
MIAYKAAKHGDTRVLITLEIPDDATTNLDRYDIVNKDTAKYRSNKVKVLKIEDDDGKDYETATSAFVTLGFRDLLTYKVGETLVEPTYDPDPDKVCSDGIHFFLHKSVVEQYGWEPHATWSGVLRSYYDNGMKEYEVMLKDGKKDGLHTAWYKSGLRDYQFNFKNGKADGLYEKWYENGVKDCETMYNDGIPGGFNQWYDNGQLKVEGQFVNNKYEKLREWNRDGTVMEP